MSETQLYSLVHKAREKLSLEISRPNHRLRLLVGHVNLLDALMIYIAKAEQRQELWFNECIRNNDSFNETYKGWIQQLHSIPEEPESVPLAVDTKFLGNDDHCFDGNKHSVNVAKIASLGELSLDAVEDGYGADCEDDEDVEGNWDSYGEYSLAPLERCKSCTEARCLSSV